MNQSTSPSAKRRSIFRPDAARRYAQGKETAVLPRLIAPPTFALLWIVLATLALGLLASWFVQIPIFATGTAVIIQDPSPKPDGVALVAFLPAANLPNLAAGQSIYWRPPGSGERVGQTVTAVSPKVMSPAEISKAYPASVGSAITQPSVVLTATLETAVLGSDPGSQLGALYPIDIEIDTRSILSLLPLLGEAFEEIGD